MYKKITPFFVYCLWSQLSGIQAWLAFQVCQRRLHRAPRNDQNKTLDQDHQSTQQHCTGQSSFSKDPPALHQWVANWLPRSALNSVTHAIIRAIRDLDLPDDLESWYTTRVGYECQTIIFGFFFHVALLFCLAPSCAATIAIYKLIDLWSWWPSEN